jgi:signal peptidase I
VPVFAQEAQNQAVQNQIDNLARTPLSQVVLLVAACTVLRLVIHPFLMRVPIERRGTGFTVLRIVNEVTDAVVYAGVFVFLLIRPFVVQTFTIPSESMTDTLLVGDYIIANKGIYRFSDPQFGDIVVFKPPAHALLPGQKLESTDFIKRCRGVPGDVIEIRDGIFYRNGQRVVEPFVKLDEGWDRMTRDFKLVKYKGKLWPLSISGSLVNADQVHTAPEFQVEDLQLMKTLLNLPAEPIPPNYYLMIGDNREGSYDGRAWGLVPRESMIAKSMFIWLPLPRMRLTH